MVARHAVACCALCCTRLQRGLIVGRDLHAAPGNNAMVHDPAHSCDHKAIIACYTVCSKEIWNKCAVAGEHGHAAPKQVRKRDVGAPGTLAKHKALSDGLHSVGARIESQRKLRGLDLVSNDTLFEAAS